MPVFAVFYLGDDAVAKEIANQARDVSHIAVTRMVQGECAKQTVPYAGWKSMVAKNAKLAIAYAQESGIRGRSMTARHQASLEKLTLR